MTTLDLTESIAPKSDQPEQWRPVVGFEGSYEVSDLGRVRGLDRLDARGRVRRGKFLAARTTTRNHQSVALYRDRVRTDAQIHHVVLEAFVGSRPDGLEGCHWNGDPTDNRLTNLRWDTRSANVADSVRHGTHAMAARTHCPRRHPYIPENTYIYPAGNRACRECRRQQKHEREQRAQTRKAA